MLDPEYSDFAMDQPVNRFSENNENTDLKICEL